MKVNRYLIIDGYNQIHRAKGGFQKGDWPIVFNFFRSLRPLIEQFLPLDDVYFVLEGSPNRQEVLLPEYKANRLPADDDFIRQKDAVINIMKMMPIKTVMHPGFEADDVISNLAKSLSVDGSKIIVVSSDSDFTQLVSDNIDVWDWRKKKFLVKPNYDYVAWKALRGDPTDNIPKCSGITDESAIAIINDTNRFKELMNNSVTRETFQRNVELIRFKEFTENEKLGYVYYGCNNHDDDKRMFDLSIVKEKFVSYDFKSMTKEPTWTKWCDTFTAVGS